MTTKSLKHLLEEWIPQQRWFTGSGHVPRLQRIGTVRMGDVVDPQGRTVALSTVYVADRATVPATIYQVPLTVRSAVDADEKVTGGHLGQVPLASMGLSDDPDELGTVHDAAHDPAYAAAIMAMAQRETSWGEDPVRMKGIQLKARRPHKPPYIVTGSRVLPPDHQSNTSIIVTTLGGRPNAPRRETAIIKLFRVVQTGANPDVELQLELAKRGSTSIPTPLGSVEGAWPDPETGEERTGHLAFASEYLGDVPDAWAVANKAARKGKRMAKKARRLGETVAQVHSELAEALGTVTVDAVHRTELTDRMRTRLDHALAQVPELEPLRAEATARIDALDALDWPLLQRVHGDLHLGQVLEVPDRGWVVVDFEGEPMRPVRERRAPDLALRDLAGMLRSIDYVAGARVREAEAAGTPLDAAGRAELDAWAQGVREAFLEGYTSVAGARAAEPRALLEALEVDKAFYEAVHERRNRPDWAAIPVRALERMLGITLSPAVTQRPTVAGGATGGTTSAGPADAREGGSGDDGPSPVADGTPGSRVSGPGSDDVRARSDEADEPGPTRSRRAGATRFTFGSGATGPRDASPAGGDTSPAAGQDDPAAVSREEALRIVQGRSSDPHAVLGLHAVADGVVIRALRPRARRVVAVLPDESRHELTHQAEGIFGAHLPGVAPTDYRLEVVWPLPGPAARTRGQAAEPRLQDDGYRQPPGIDEMDLHLVREGRHERLWTVLGAHLRRVEGPMGTTRGVGFSVWAPHARGVRVVGDFNQWDGTAHPLRRLGDSGVWELFVPGVGAGERYMFQITTAEGTTVTKADPMARRAEVPPGTASVVDDSSARDFGWTDEAWMAQRGTRDPLARPMSVYEVHLGSWRRGLGYRELAEQLVEHVRECGFTHVELLPVAEHPYAPSWGYQVTGYYAPTARFGTPDEFRHLVDALHAAGIGVIVDWVPGHFPKDEWALARFDGQPLYEHPDPRRGDHPDWGTHVFDYGRHEVRNFLVANVLYWLEEFHVDGIRVDGVASMLYLDHSRADGEWAPNQYGGRENLEAVQLLQDVNVTAHRLHPGIVTVAEESTAWPGVTTPTYEGGLGFSLKWNTGWIHDSLEYVARDPEVRRLHHQDLTFSMAYAYSERYVLPLSHDEVVHGKGSLVTKMPGDTWQKYAGVRAYLAFMWAHPGKKLLFMGSELGVPREWAEGASLDFDIDGDPLRAGVRATVQDLNARYAELPALWQLDHDPAGFRWIDSENAAGQVISFLRTGHDPAAPGGTLAVVVNFSDGPHEDLRVGLPHAGRWREVLSTDATRYGGSGVGNPGEVVAEEVPTDGLPASAVVRVPPLGAVWFVPVTDDPQGPDGEALDGQAGGDEQAR
ncbi:1,4-alpha-glucan branching protein GlgB [Kytococcus schroeteri]|uniref:1,4-alpha-glucan branching protein GlgB n=1 Tax=Kytococcus schroeteri TaxID=138300 RepID=UPI0011428522|nr:1,4-alpha-glucan branching protein GlgB [Kytococcus schroeteri]